VPCAGERHQEQERMIVKARIAALSQLNLMAVSAAAVPAIARLYTECATVEVDKLDGEILGRIARLVEWSMSLADGGLWTVSVDGAESNLLGCALVRHAGVPGGARVSVALKHQLWGAGRAFDIARVLGSLYETRHWTSSAESLAPPESAYLQRTTLSQLIAAPDVDPSTGREAQVLLPGVLTKPTLLRHGNPLHSSSPSRRRNDA
jgi:hypothetical protein